MAIDNVALTIDNEDIRYHLDAQCTLEVAIGDEQHIVFLIMVIDKGFHLIDVLPLVNGYCEYLDTRLLLPVFIHLADGIELAVARLAPRSEEIDDKRLTTIGKRIDVDGLAIHGLDSHGGKLRIAWQSECQQQSKQGKE